MAEPSETSETPEPPAHQDEHYPHLQMPTEFGGIAHEFDNEDASESTVLSRAIGGWRGMVDSSLPSLVFLIVYLASHHNLKTSVWAALIAGAVIAVWRLIRRQSIQQVLAGFVGVAISAWIATKTGNAANFFLPGLLLNAAYALGLIISVLVRWPIVGLAVGGATGDLTGWRKDPQLRRVYNMATWLFAGVFVLRLAVQLPLYFAGAVGALAVAKIVTGIPPYALAAWLTYRMVKPPFMAAKARKKAEAATASATEAAGSESD